MEKRDNLYSKEFSSKATWRLTRTEHPKVDWYNGIWFPLNTMKNSVMAWIAVQNWLPTGDRISKWNMASMTTCYLCPELQVLETRNHLFYHCCFSEEIWKNLSRKLLSVNYTNNWDNIIRILRDQTRRHVYVFQATLSTICGMKGTG